MNTDIIVIDSPAKAPTKSYHFSGPENEVTDALAIRLFQAQNVDGPYYKYISVNLLGGRRQVQYWAEFKVGYIESFGSRWPVKIPK